MLFSYATLVDGMTMNAGKNVSGKKTSARQKVHTAMIATTMIYNAGMSAPTTEISQTSGLIACYTDFEFVLKI